MIRRAFFFALLLSCLAASSPRQSSPNVRLTWIGQSGFLIQSEGGPAIISDPPSNNLGFLFPATPADVVTVSHTHGDHANTAAVQGTPTLVDGRNVTERREVMAAGMTFVVVPGFHDVQGNTRNSIVKWTQGDMRFAQCGDYGQAALTEAQLEDLRDLDVAFISVSHPNLVPAQAKAFIEQLRPRIAILCHFRTPLGGAAVTLTFKDVTAPFTNLVYKPNNVTLQKDRLPATPEVWVMEPSANAVTVNSASYGGGVPVAPGSLASLFGNFTSAGTATGLSFPLPTMLGNVEVVVGGQATPLLYVSPTQINFQVPGRLETPGQALAEVKVSGTTVARAQVTTLSGAPGVFVATDRDYRLNAAGTPARRGEPIIIWATGHGELSDTPGDGQPAPAPPLTTKAQPRVTIGGVEAEVLFSGLTPGLAGVWQINAVVPSDAPVGASVPLVITQGLTGNTLPIAVRE